MSAAYHISLKLSSPTSPSLVPLFLNCGSLAESTYIDPTQSSPRSSMSFLLTRSSLALVLVGPHLSRMPASLSLCFSWCSLGAWQHIMTNVLLQPNCFDSAITLLVTGSSARRRRISVMSSGLRWCIFGCSGVGRKGSSGGSLFVAGDDGVREEKSAGRLARRRGSFLGRNLNGVEKIEGSEEGGLKIMWSALGAPSEVMKDGCGGTRRARLCRDEVAWCRICWCDGNLGERMDVEDWQLRAAAAADLRAESCSWTSIFKD